MQAKPPVIPTSSGRTMPKFERKGDGKCKSDRREAFKRIEAKDKVAPLLPHHAKHVGCADIAAPMLSDVDAARARNNQSAGKGTKEVANSRGQKII